MNRRDPKRLQARPTTRTRRLEPSLSRDAWLRAHGIDPRTGRPLDPRDGGPEPAPPRPVPFRRVVGWGLVVVVVVLVVGSALLYQRVDTFNSQVSPAGTLSSALLLPLNGSERVNVAFFGYSGQEGHGGRYLSDSINILSIDPAGDTSTLIAVPRDLWIAGSPLLPEGGKANEPFAAGWRVGGVREAGRAATAVLAEVTGLTIEHWVALDFDGFASVVDAIGGVDLDNPTAFAYTLTEKKYEAGVFDAGSFAAGPIHLDGPQALAYTRARYASPRSESGDYSRSIRQQRVLAAVRAKLGAGFPGSLGLGLAAMDALAPQLATDLSAIDLALISGELNPDARIALKVGDILDATFNDKGQYILVVLGRTSETDYAPLHAFLATRLATPIVTPQPSPTSSE